MSAEVIHGDAREPQIYVYRSCLLWLMLIRGKGWRYTKAEPPCMKGEIAVSALGFQVILGWQRAQPRIALEQRSAAPGTQESPLTCNDCGAPYGEDGWCDVVVPDPVWNKIAPEGGLLCFRCMTKRIVAHGLDRVPVIVASGPYTDANEDWRMIGWEHGHKVGLAERESSGRIE